MNSIRVPFFQLKQQHQTMRSEIQQAMANVLDRDQFILGPEVAAFEKEFAAYVNAKFAVGVGSGTDALTLSLRALDIGIGDEVITVANTATPTVVAISQTGATPVFVDIVKDGFHLNANELEAHITPKTKAIVPVHLYGQPAEMDSIINLANQHGLPVIEDACQAHGAMYDSKKVGGLGTLGCFSFYPTKNLGGLGDGGMITFNNPDFLERLQLLRNYGQKSKYEHVAIGFNSRLDEIQAAVLRVKLKHLDAFNSQRNEVAQIYSTGLSNPDILKPPETKKGASVNHIYAIRCQARDKLQTWLKERGIATLIHYPTPIHLQKAYSFLGYQRGDLPNSERHTDTVLSLPVYPEFPHESAQTICDLINQFKV